MDTTLIIMAAGIGSRYGAGIKQLAKMGPNGEIMQAFAKEYGLSFSCAQSDVGQFMMELRQQGII